MSNNEIEKGARINSKTAKRFKRNHFSSLRLLSRRLFGVNLSSHVLEKENGPLHQLVLLQMNEILRMQLWHFRPEN
jgi:hypothetical protein